MQRIQSRRRLRAVFTGLIAALCPLFAAAHPIIQNAIDVVISREKITLDVRVAMEEVLLVENGGKPGAASAPEAPAERLPALVEAHKGYVLKRLQMAADHAPVAGTVLSASLAPATAGSAPGLAVYRIEYPLKTQPQNVELRQTFLIDYQWQAACVVRVRQEGEHEWQSAVITGVQHIEYGCSWEAAVTQPTKASSGTLTTRIDFWPTTRTYLGMGIEHILGWDSEAHRPAGLDHILFVCALVLAVRSLWDLVKVVTAFTLAHTVTLTLSVLNWVTMPERIVEPMIAGSIVCIALQNVIWPKSSRGKLRLAIAFAFGLFHGLGFAGKLKQSMAELPGSAMANALVSFSAGVEIGHQVVVIPLFALLYACRNWKTPEGKPRQWVGRWAVPVASCVIAVAGGYFLIDALRGHG